jgi:hypothetical protein
LGHPFSNPARIRSWTILTDSEPLISLYETTLLNKLLHLRCSNTGWQLERLLPEAVVVGVPVLRRRTAYMCIMRRCTT